MKNVLLNLTFLSLFLSACNTDIKDASTNTIMPKEGEWLAQINLNDSITVPFHFDVTYTSDSTYYITVKNAEERIEVKQLSKNEDSTVFQMPVFANYISAIVRPMEMRGYFHNPDAENYKLPFTAQYQIRERFPFMESACCNLNEKWRMKFGKEPEKVSDGIGYFNQDDSMLVATVLTETGDYRYLEGMLSGDEFKLSTFDGAHLFYFEGVVSSGQKIEGRFYSGRSFMEPFIAYRDDDFELTNPDSLTFLKEGVDSLTFSFPTPTGKVVSLSDPRFKNKAVVIQIMGSWCPNCMDETRFLNEMYTKYQPKGLEIVGVTFERAKTKGDAVKRANKMIDDLGISYPVLMGGYTREDDASEAFSSLNHVMSYPTAIFLDKNHQVVKIHTGFAGPGTPVYTTYTKNTDQFLNNLVNAKK